MTTLEQGPDRPQGYLEGRIEEQSVALQDLKAGQQELSRRIDTVQQDLSHRIDSGLQEVRAGQQEMSRRLDTVHQELSNKIDSGLREARVSQRQLVVTLLLVGGGLFAGLVGSVTALMIRLG